MATFTLIHVLISLVGIGTGLIVALGLIRSQRMDSLTGIFLATTVLTSVTGFFFPFNGVTPGIVVGVLSLLVLAPAIYGRYSAGLRGGWRRVYVIGSTVALYFNVFVLIVQSFQKIPVLNALAPTGAEVPFQIVQGIALVAFIVIGYLATKRFIVPSGIPQVQGRAKSATSGR